jgi:hypothetical protein
MAFIFFMFGLAMVLFGTAWGLVTIEAPTPLVMAACLLVAGIAIGRSVWRFSAGQDATASQSKWMLERQLYRRRRSHHAQAANSH